MEQRQQARDEGGLSSLDTSGVRSLEDGPPIEPGITCDVIVVSVFFFF